MDLEERKKRLLEAIIETYVATAEPVGSRVLSKMYPLSSATIRNEMSDLEDMGLLEKTHLSSGRIPSNFGYRIYVDQLMKKYELTKIEEETLKSILKVRISEVDNLMSEVADIYSMLTNYTVFTVTPVKDKSYIKHIQLMPIDGSNVLLALVTDKNVVKTKQIVLSEAISASVLTHLTDVLNRYISGRREENISLYELQRLQIEIGSHYNILVPILNLVSKSINELNDSEVFLKGISNLLGLPEYGDIGKARRILKFLEEHSNIHKVLRLECLDDVQVMIGEENLADELKDCSLITTKYHLANDKVGVVGIIGPTRMNYSRAVSMLRFFSNQMNLNMEDE